MFISTTTKISIAIHILIYNGLNNLTELIVIIKKSVWMSLNKGKFQIKKTNAANIYNFIWSIGAKCSNLITSLGQSYT